MSMSHASVHLVVSNVSTHQNHQTFLESSVNVSCFGSSCGVQCVDSSKSPNVSGVFCQCLMLRFILWCPMCRLIKITKRFWSLLSMSHASVHLVVSNVSTHQNHQTFLESSVKTLERPRNKDGRMATRNS